MKIIRIPYSQLVSILTDYKERLQEDGIQSPFDHATDSLLSTAAGNYIKMYINSQQRHTIRHRPDPFTSLLTTIGYPINKMRQGALDELVSDMDDFLLRLSNFTSYLLSPIEDSLPWCVSEVTIDDNTEDVVVHIGQDHRIGMYYVLRKELVEIASPVTVKVPRQIKEMDDLIEVEESFNSIVDSIFRQVTSEPVTIELKKKFIEYISSKG